MTNGVDDAQDGEITIPARKLFEIVRALPDGSKVTVSQNGDKVTVQAGRSRFSLASLPANDFPSIDEFEATDRVSVAPLDWCYSGLDPLEVRAAIRGGVSVERGLAPSASSPHQPRRTVQRQGSDGPTFPARSPSDDAR